MKLTKEQVLGRIQAYEECIGRLILSWWNEEEEFNQGMILREKLIKERDKIIEKYKVLEV